MEFTSDLTAQLVQFAGGDESVLASMLVSTSGAESLKMLEEDPAGSYGRINFLMKNRHGTPFEHASMTFFVEAPIAVFREWHRHRIGWCLAGDTEVWCETWGTDPDKPNRTVRKNRIDWLYENWHKGVTDSLGRVRLLDSCRNFTARCLNEDTQMFELARVQDIVCNGRKKIHRLTLQDGKTLRASEDHQIYTSEGWQTLGSLTPDSMVAVNGKRSLYQRSVPPSLRSGIDVWTSMQRNALIKPFDTCYVCENGFDRDDLELDHVVPVVVDLLKALDVHNLQPICTECHRVKTSGEQALAQRGNGAGTKFVRVQSITPESEEVTYDLVLEGPWRGFVANGIVVHNSYNEESGRYKVLEPKFYVPPPERPLVQVGKPGHYEFVVGEEDQYLRQVDRIKKTCQFAYNEYLDALDDGVAKEVARGVLPVYTYTSMYATTNPRSLMAFLSLRTKELESMFPSFPMWEIEQCARHMEEQFASLFPLTYRAFNENGRVAP